jgi:hypothetical protein
MKRIATITAGLLLCYLELAAHPGTALVADSQNNVYFAYWGGTWKLGPTGTIERVHANDFHFLAIDVTGRFSDVRLREALRITPGNAKPALFAFSDYPAVFHTDGYLYVAPWSPGRIRLERLKPDGQKDIFVDAPIDPRVARTPGRHEGGLLAVTAGPNSLLYVSDGASIWKINSQGLVSTVVENVTVSDCPRDLPAELPRPHIRSLAVGANGDIYAAAIGCRAVLRITSSGQTTSVLRAESPWSPCAVTIASGEVYVMEYDNPLAERAADGRPRIRKITRSGQVVTLHVAEQAKK